METPRTNKNAGYYCGHGIKKNSDLVIDPNGPFVLADFARELERENSRLRCALLALVEAEKASRDNFDSNSIERIEQAMQRAERVLFPERFQQNTQSSATPKHGH